MDQTAISSLDDLHTRWGKPPSSLDAATIAYLYHGLTLERNSCPELGLRRRQGWKMAQQVLGDVAAVVANPPSPPASSSHTHPSPLEPFAHGRCTSPLDRLAMDPAPLATPGSPGRHRPLAGMGIKEKYFAYLDLLTGAATKVTSQDGHNSANEGQDSSSSSATDSDDEASTCSTTTVPSPMAKPSSSAAKHLRATTSTPVAVPTNAPAPPSPISSPVAGPDEHGTPATTALMLQPLLLSRLNATWSNLLALDLASRTVEHRVARDLGALRRQREMALDELLDDLMSWGPEGEALEGRYSAAMKALAAKVEGGEENGERVGVMGEWMSKSKQREVEGGVGGAAWEGLGDLRKRVEQELVERGLLEYEGE